jgi:carbamoyl-phosphate synthase large subunit
VLVTGAGGAPSANFVDSLRQADEPLRIVGTDASREMIELAPVDVRYLVPRADADPHAYLEELRAVISAEGVDFVHAQPDGEVLLLAQHAAELGAATYFPTAATVALCQDKAAFAGRLRDAAVPTPEFVVAGSREELGDAASDIVRAHDKAWVRARRGAGSRAALPVTRPAQALSWADWWVEERGLDYGDFMISEFLPGREFGFQSLWRDGELLTSQARERVTYLFGHLFPSGQSSSPAVARTVHRADVNEMAQRAVAAVDPDARGVFCVDLKENADGVPLVTEINCGRFFTTSNFFARAGINMPWHYVQLGLGRELPAIPRVNAVEEGLYWVRMVDMGYTLVRDGEWTSRRVSPEGG